MKRRNFILAALVSAFTAPACESKPPERSFWSGLPPIELSQQKIKELRARAKTIPIHFDLAEVVVRYEGKERRMTYEEFLVRTGMV